jgi:hypothetical protein
MDFNYIAQLIKKSAAKKRGDSFNIYQACNPGFQELQAYCAYMVWLAP